MKLPDKFFRRLTLVWGMAVVTATILIVFLRVPDISASTASALGIVVGILTVPIGYYFHIRNKETKKDNKNDIPSN